jgi:hypothetical protein
VVTGAGGRRRPAPPTSEWADRFAHASHSLAPTPATEGLGIMAQRDTEWYPTSVEIAMPNWRISIIGHNWHANRNHTRTSTPIAHSTRGEPGNPSLSFRRNGSGDERFSAHLCGPVWDGRFEGR